ncbi:MAG: carboxymuconolactone decarboxylase family protein [Alphaproteobacteria bacterium]
MSQRLDYKTISPEGYRAMAGLSRVVSESGFDKALIHLVKLRVSQINGCAYCCWLHAKDLRAVGVKQAHIDVLPAWREANSFSAQERAALAWAEAVTLVSQTHAPDDVYQEALKQFGDKLMVALTYLIIEINAWNRLAIPFRMQPPAD